MLAELKDALTKNISNLPGWSTNRKIIVFLVDDWGAVRIRDRKAWLDLKRAGIDVESNRFNKYDTLEGKDDLSALFDVLKSVKDVNNNTPVFTAVTAVANPDFEKIQQSNLQDYFYEPFIKTLDKYAPTSGVFELWRQGINEKIFHPQFHGREHLNVKMWMKALQSGNANVLKAFNVQSIGVRPSHDSHSNRNYMAAYDFETSSDLEQLKDIARTGVSIFENVFYEKPNLFTAPSLIHNSAIEPTLNNLGIKFIDRGKVTQEPTGSSKYKKKYFYLGQKNKQKQLYITRNCLFEPTQNLNSVDSVMSDISIAFRWNKPAIISSHRVNFVGGIDESNRANGLIALIKLLKNILAKWPDVEFMSSSELGLTMSASVK